MGARWGKDLDGGAGRATVDLLAKAPDGDHVAPLISDVLAEGQTITIELAHRTTPGDPAAADWIEVFDGIVTGAEWAASPMRVTARERLLDEAAHRFVERETEYGDDDGRDLHLTMRDLIADWLPDQSLVVAGGDSEAPGFKINTYAQRQESVKGALDTLAGLAGWTVQQRWDDDADAFALTLLRPDRTGTTADWTLTTDDYSRLGRVQTDLDRVRNVVEVVWQNASGQERTVLRSNADSINAVGRRWMRYEATKQIDTDTEAVVLANAILSDLAADVIDVTVETRLHWAIELSDLWELPDDDRHWTVEQKLGVVGFQHTWNGPEQDRTTVTLRGNPAGQRGGWLVQAQATQEDASIRYARAYRTTEESEGVDGLYAIDTHEDPDHSVAGRFRPTRAT